ncbi:MAG: ScyD/ScyE family protein [Candidatus Limnocylindria bacterium]
MRSRAHARRSLSALLLIAALTLPTPAAALRLPESFSFTTPAFHVSPALRGGLFVADAGAGIVKLAKGTETLVAPLPGVTDVAHSPEGGVFAVTGGGPEPPLDAAKLYHVTGGGRITQVADLREFEATVNPDGSDIVDTNPFSVVTLEDRRALVADAGGNVLIIANERGRLDWVALFPDEVVSTQNIKSLAGCPEPAPGFEFACGLPDMMSAQPVPTSIAIGPDGAYYVGELKGFPAPTGESRIWRIEAGTRHADCATSPACSVVADGFTSIVDLNFGPDGTLYVTELDEASWAAVEFGLGSLGGTVSACASATWTCSVVAGDLPMPMSATIAHDGRLYALLLGLVPGSAEVVRLP